MKKIKIIFALYLFSAQGILAQNKIVLPGDPGAAGKAIVQKEAMINGKPYSQYKAEQDAMKQRTMAKKPGDANYVSPISATPNEPKPVNNSPRQNENNETQKPVAAPAVTEAAVVKQTAPAPEVPAALRIPEARAWTGRAVETGNGATSAPGVVMPKSDPGQPLTGEDFTKAKSVAPKATQKPASRSGNVTEK